MPSKLADGRDLSLRVRMVGLFAVPIVFLVALAVPLPGLSGEAHTLVAIFGWAVVFWVTEAVPTAVTALLTSLLTIVLGVAPARTVFGAYGDPVIFLFIGSFMLAEAMRGSGLDRRVAFALLDRPWTTRSPARLLCAVGLVTAGISLWVSNTATTAIMLPIGQGMLANLGPAGDPDRSRYPIGFMLMLTWASSVTVGLPIASPPNLIAMGMLDELAAVHVTFLQWVLVTMPLTGAMLGLCWVLLHWRYPAPPGAAHDVGAFVQQAHDKLGGWTRAERNVAVVFSIADVL